MITGRLHRKKRLRNMLRVAVVGLLIGIPACRTPAWCARTALRCLPNAADSSASSFWARCPDQKAPSAPPVDDSTSKSLPSDRSSRDSSSAVNMPVQLTNWNVGNILDKPKEQSDKDKTTEDAANNRFKLPAALPGADTPPLSVPKQGLKTDDAKALKEREQAYEKLFPPVSKLDQTVEASPDAAFGPLGLEQLQQMASENNPAIRAEAAAVESARGKMIQAGLPPNPSVGYQADTVRTAFTNGYHGAYIQQTLITAQKLGLAARAAAVDHANACLNLRKTWYATISEVRRQYFNTLAARKRLELADALLQLSERSYQTQVELVKAGEAAAYEPLQLRVLTTQARATAIQAQQDSIAAWRSLSAAIGLPDLAPSAINGRIDCPVPSIEYETARQQLLTIHTDIQTARNLVGKNRTLVTLADRQPIPDVNVEFVLQRDYTFTPGTDTYNIVIGGPIPVFDRNQGNRVAARAELVRASESVTAVGNQLIAQLAPVYATYQTNRILADSFKTEALQDQVRAYRGVYQRYHTDPTGISFNDIVVAQQTLAATLTQYISILQLQWQGVVGIGELLQVDDLFQLGPTVQVAQLPVVIEGNQ
jgi:outer membrane protein, heavy metal efflux system